MAKLEVQVVYEINGTVCNDFFLCDHASRDVVSRNVAATGASITFTNGIEKASGRPVGAVLYSQMWRVLTFKVEPD